MNRYVRPLLALPLLASLSGAALAQAPHPLSPAEHERVEKLIHAMTLEQKLAYIGGTGFDVRAVPDLSLPTLTMSDGPYGTRSNAGFPSTTYAAGIGLAASWDPALAAQVGGGIGRDARARGVMFMLGPGVNIYRSPRNGRNFEYFGEDPFLASNIAVGYITGMQQQGVSSTIKHYLGNNSEFLRHDSDSIIGERALREIYMPTFEAAVKKANVGAFMDSYNLINGLHATQNPVFNIDVLRKDWGFHGVMMSDWDATYSAVGAANGGLDLEMPTGKFMNAANLMPAIRSGAVKEATIDLKVRHILETAVSFGWLDRPQTDLSISAIDQQNDRVALQSAREGIVLLKNDGDVLPLQPATLKTLLVVGPNAYPGVAVGGGSAGVVPFHLVSDLEGITKKLGPATNVLYSRGLPSLNQLSQQTNFTTAASGGHEGVTHEVFASSDLSGQAVTTTANHIALTGLSIKLIVENMATMDFDSLFGDKKKISHRFTGFYNAAKDGNYLVVLEGAGEGSGERVFVDGKQLIDNWKIVRAFQPSVTIPLSAGPHKVVVEEYQNNPVGGHMVFAIAPQDTIVDQKAIEMAKHADAVVIAAGFAQESESEGGDRTFGLPYGQNELINAMAAANPKTIVAVTSGGGWDAEPWIGQVPAVVENWYGGQDGGTALAEVLTGDVNPSGHLPITIERRAEDNPTYANYYPADGGIEVEYKEGIFVGYRGYEKNGVQPLFPFGYGLSYTTFAFSGLKVVPEFNSAEPHVTVFFDVKNTGTKAGATVAQVYVGEEHAPLPRPAHELKGFERVELAAGETKRVSVELDPRAFSYWDDRTKGWKIDSGRFTISVGDSVANLPLVGSVESPKH